MLSVQFAGKVGSMTILVTPLSQPHDIAGESTSIVDHYYTMRFGGPIEWTEVTVYNCGAREEVLHLSKRAKDGLSIGMRT